MDGHIGGLPAPGFQRLIFPGTSVSANVSSPLGTLSGAPYMIVADLQPFAGAAPLQLPGEPGVVGVSSTMVTLVDAFQGLLPAGMPSTLPTTGTTLTGVPLAFLPTTRLVVQAAVADPQAPNGLAITEVFGGHFAGLPSVTGTSGASSILGQFGYAVHATDLDGDGLPEVIIGAREEDAPGGSVAGRVFIYSGSPLALQHTLDDPSPEAGSHYGVSCSTGDVNGDGVVDIIVGARQKDVNGLQDAGQVVIFFGPAYAQTHTIDAPIPEFRGQFGHRTICGDFNGDGSCDLAVASIGSTVGAVVQAGTLDVFFGPAFSSTVRVDNPVPSPGDRFGYRLCAEDIDGDGTDDLIVAAPFKSLIGSGVDDSGAIYTLLGPAFGLHTYFPNPSPSVQGLLGADVSCADLDADGDLDIIAGAELDDSGGLAEQGSVYVLRGPTFASVDQYFSPSPTAGGGFGSGVDAADWDGDGVIDLMVGEFFYTGPTFRQGRAHVLLGPDYLQSVAVEEPVTGSSYQFGRRVRAVDLDGDGDYEMLVGVPQSSAPGITRVGAVYVVEL
jgi:hypothetical protein